MKLKIQLSLLFICMVLSATPNLKIGWAERDISTDLPVAIPGNFDLRISNGMADTLTLTVLVLDNGRDSAVFLSCDLLNLTGMNYDELGKMIRKTTPDFPCGKWIFNATHTHTGAALRQPGRTGIPAGKEFDDKGLYRTRFLEAAASAAAEAWKNRKPGQVAWGYGFAAAGFSRRTIYKDDLSKRKPYRKTDSALFNGHGMMHGPNDDRFSHYEAGMDPFINFLFTFDANDKLTGAIINLSTTAQCGAIDPFRLSADFWHETRQYLRKKHGRIFILPQCAAAGDITPRQQHYQKALARRLRLKFGKDSSNFSIRLRMDVAERIGTAFAEVLTWASKDRRSNPELKHIRIRTMLKRDIPSPELVAEARKRLQELESTPEPELKDPAADLKAKSRRKTAIARYKAVIRCSDEFKKTPSLTAELHLIRIGDIAFASNPFELFIDYMHRIQRLSPFEQTFIVQLSRMGGTAGGYLPTQKAVENLGYSAEPCSHQISPEGGDQFVKATVQGLRTLKK